MMQFIKEILARYDLKLAHNRSDTWSSGVDLLGLIGHRVLDGVSPLRILQIGANDGRKDDWLKQFVSWAESSAVLVEPLPGPFTKLQALYKESKNVRCVNAALDSSTGEATIHHAHFEGECPAQFTLLASFEKRVINKHRSAINAAGGSIRELRVPTVTASWLLDHFPNSGPEIIGIDTEGFDAIAVNLLLDAGAAPIMLVYEHCHTRGVDDERCRARLRESGYLLARINRDTVAVQAEAWERQ